MSNIKYVNFQEYVMKLQQRIHVLIALPMILFVVFLIKIENGKLHPHILDSDHLILFRKAVAIFSGSVILAALIFPALNIKKIRLKPDLRSRLDSYFSVILIRNYLLEIILIINLIGMSLTGERFYVALFGITLFVFLMAYPNQMRIISLLKLGPEDSEIILHRKEIK